MRPIGIAPEHQGPLDIGGRIHQQMGAAAFGHEQIPPFGPNLDGFFLKRMEVDWIGLNWQSLFCRILNLNLESIRMWI
jgi:hypothetical protein